MKKNFLTMALAGLGMMAYAQDATFKYFKYEGDDARFDTEIDASRQYLNPVVAGFAADPSVCRVGDTYYLINSSFSFYPGVPLWTSTDLVNWSQLGYVLDRPSQLPLKGQGVSGGVFAPQISYNKKNKTFYMITTNVGMGNFYVKSKDPAKGWSDPVMLPKVGGIDPSFTFLDNGKAYIVNNDAPSTAPRYDGERSIYLHEFDWKGDSTVGEQVEILRGGTSVVKNPIWIEGPHLYKIGKYYYLMCAEGGTGDFHSEVILRSKKPEGPYEEFSGNPILTQRHLNGQERKDPVSTAGHADMVQAKDGSWWAVFLACRPYDVRQDLYNTGRETFLLPVTWKDGWPTILPAGEQVPTVVDKEGLGRPAAVPQTGNFTYTDRFEGGKLGLRWQFLRNPSDFYALGPDGITIRPSAGNIYETVSPSAVFTRQQHLAFTAETEVAYTPLTDEGLAGVCLFQNEKYNFVLGITRLDGKNAIALYRTEKATGLIASAPLPASVGSLRLKVAGDGRYYSFYYAEPGGEWQLLARGVDGANLSTHRAGGFVGTYIGLYATDKK